MIEYKDNEAYEKVRKITIDALETVMNDDYDEVAINFADLADLLRQSKWVGSYNVTAYEDGYQAGYFDGANDEEG